MIKILTVFVRRPDLSRRQFREYYEGHHVKLALRHVAAFGFRKYVRNHVAGDAEPGFDCLTEFFFESADRAARSAGFMQTAEGRVFADDELNFLDMSHHPSFELTEQVLFGPPRGVDTGSVRKSLLLLERGEGTSAEDLARRALEFGRSLAATQGRAMRRLMLDLAVQGPGREAPFDAMLTLWPTDPRAPADLLRWPDASDRSRAVEIEALEASPRELGIA